MNEFGLKQAVLDFIIEAARECDMDEVVLFGSRATGRFAPKSDIDLAISGNRFNDFTGLLDEKCPTLLSFDFVNLSNSVNSELQKRILEEGVQLYG